MLEKRQLHFTIHGKESCSTNFQISSRFLHEYNSNIELKKSIDSFLEDFNKKYYTNFSMESIAPLFFGEYYGEQTRALNLLLKDFLESFSLELNYQDMAFIFKYNILANLDDLEIQTTTDSLSFHLNSIHTLQDVVKNFVQDVKDKINGAGEVENISVQKDDENKNNKVEGGKKTKSPVVAISNSEKMRLFFSQEDSVIREYILNLDGKGIYEFYKIFFSIYVTPVLEEYKKNGKIAKNKKGFIFFCENLFLDYDNFNHIKAAFGSLYKYGATSCTEKNSGILKENVGGIIEVAKGKELLPISIVKKTHNIPEKPHNIPENLGLSVTLDVFKKNDAEIEQFFNESPLEVHLELLRLVLESEKINSLYDASKKTGRTSIRSFLKNRLADFHDLGTNVPSGYLYALSNGNKNNFFLYNYKGLRQLLGIDVSDNQEVHLEDKSITSGEDISIGSEDFGESNKSNKEGIMMPLETRGKVERIFGGDEYDEYMNLNLLFLEDSEIGLELIKNFTITEKQGLLELIYSTYIRKYGEVVGKGNTENIDAFFAKQIAEKGDSIENFVIEIQKIHNSENTNFFSENHERIKKFIQKIEEQIAIEYSETDEKIAENLEKRSLIKRKEVIIALFARYNNLRKSRGLKELYSENIEGQVKVINQAISTQSEDYLEDILVYIGSEETTSDMQLMRLVEGFKKIAHNKIDELSFPQK